MTAQLHLTHRKQYLRGIAQGGGDEKAGRDYRPQDCATGTPDERHAFTLGYCDGWSESADSRTSNGRDTFGITSDEEITSRFRNVWDEDISDDLNAVLTLNEAFAGEWNEAFAGEWQVVMIPEGWDIAADLIASTTDGFYDGYEVKIRAPHADFWLCAEIQTVTDTDPIPPAHLVTMAVDTANDLLAAWRDHGNG